MDYTEDLENIIERLDELLNICNQVNISTYAVVGLIALSLGCLLGLALGNLSFRFLNGKSN